MGSVDIPRGELVLLHSGLNSPSGQRVIPGSLEAPLVGVYRDSFESSHVFLESPLALREGYLKFGDEIRPFFSFIPWETVRIQEVPNVLVGKKDVLDYVLGREDLKAHAGWISQLSEPYRLPESRAYREL